MGETDYLTEGGGKGNIFGLSGGKGDEGLHLGGPDDGATCIHNEVACARVGGEGVRGGSMLPGASPIGIDKTFKASGEVGFEGETLMLGLQKIAANAFDGGSMSLLRVVAETGTLLDGHGEVWPNHGLEITEAADNGTIVPRVRVGEAVRIAVKE